MFVVRRLPIVGRVFRQHQNENIDSEANNVESAVDYVALPCSSTASNDTGKEKEPSSSSNDAITTEKEKEHEVMSTAPSGGSETGGTTFLLPVDGENKAAIFRPYSFRGIHMAAFHASWLSFFASFLSTFAPAALLPLIREDLDLDDKDIGNAGVASVCGAIFARILMGSVCDMFGPRFGHAALMMLTAPAVLGMALISGPIGFIVTRFLVGFSLATFVACQFWSSVMFNVRIVGAANAAGAGFGSSGGGITLLVMPLLNSLMEKFFLPFTAWRMTLLVPGLLHIIIGTLILSGTQDLPDGNYSELKKKGHIPTQGRMSFFVALKNYRTWLLAAVYGFSFGCELTMNNVLTSYYFDNFGVPLKQAGMLAFLYGFMNCFARPVAGVASDSLAKYYGIRGRLWILWSLHTFGAMMCILIGFLHKSLVATIVTVVLMAISVEASEAAAFAVVPFVSKRALGVVAGIVGAGGNTGATIIQAVFFNGSIPIPTALTYTGVSVFFVTLFIPFLYFPMWGGMCQAPREGATEEEYYLAEFTHEEIGRGMARLSMKFAVESRSQRGTKRVRTARRSVKDSQRSGLGSPLLGV
ncbi:hypothetical protein BSKO_12804 [Bryopsis sp. KO-2023]|nr:hypothetical protein BSKO_12804 [Bryopsis sp. KO-2023]